MLIVLRSQFETPSQTEPLVVFPLDCKRQARVHVVVARLWRQAEHAVATHSPRAPVVRAEVHEAPASGVRRREHVAALGTGGI